MEKITKEQLPAEIKDEIDVYENLIAKLMNSLDLPTEEWNKKVSPIMREFLEWHKKYK